MIDPHSDLAHQPDLRQFQSENGTVENMSTSTRINASQVTTIIVALGLIQLGMVGLIFAGLLGPSGPEAALTALPAYTLANVIDLVVGTVGFALATSAWTARRFLLVAGGATTLVGMLGVFTSDASASLGTIISETGTGATLIGQDQIQAIAPVLHLWLGVAMVAVGYGAHLNAQGAPLPNTGDGLRT